MNGLIKIFKKNIEPIKNDVDIFINEILSYDRIVLCSTKDSNDDVNIFITIMLKYMQKHNINYYINEDINYETTVNKNINDGEFFISYTPITKFKNENFYFKYLIKSNYSINIHSGANYCNLRLQYSSGLLLNIVNGYIKIEKDRLNISRINDKYLKDINRYLQISLIKDQIFAKI